MTIERGKGSLFPEGWCVPEAQDMVVNWLRWLDVDPEGKKQILLLWCDCAEVTLTKDLVDQVLGEER